MKLDVFEAITLFGFLALCSGIWWLSPPWALIIGGAMLLAFGLYAIRYGGKPGKGGEAT